MWGYTLAIVLFLIIILTAYCSLPGAPSTESFAPSHRFFHHLYVLVPCYNFESYINECLDSVLKQTYPCFTCVVVDDGSTDSTLTKIQKYMKQYPTQMTLVVSKKNQGPAWSKYVGFEAIRARANPNDVVVILDGDDYFHPDALKHIDETYKRTKCWFSYGSHSGSFTDQSKAVNTLSRTKPWRYGHPRSAKCFLLRFFNADDFQDDDDGTWLRKSTDRAFVYKCAELAGLDRISFNPDKLYHYRSHPHNIRKNKNTQTARHAASVLRRTPSDRISEPVHVCMCSWKRISNLDTILTSIFSQTISDRIVFHLINNNWDERDGVTAAVNRFRRRSRTPARQIQVHHNQQNRFAFARFEYVRDLMEVEFLDYVIFIDDDQFFDKDHMEKLYALREPRAFKPWFGKIFSPDSGYWDGLKRVSYNDLLANRKLDVSDFHYGGPGGSIIDANIFREDPLFHVPFPRAIEMDDVWLSYILWKFGWKIRRNFLPPHPIHDSTENVAMFGKYRNLKKDFFHYLTELGWTFQ